MKDVQNSRDNRGLSVDKVGVKGLKYPIIVLDRQNLKQSTIANVSMYVELPHHFKGTHMSRFIEILNSHRGEITLLNMGEILSEMQESLNADVAHLELMFTYFLVKVAPVSHAQSLMGYECGFYGVRDLDREDYILEVSIPVVSLCPCSKEICTHNAHNQRSYIKIRVRTTELVWIEELISIAEDSSSSPIYPLLKRADEKYVTEAAYEKPAFVEDLVRNVAERLLADQRIVWFSVEAESLESIHNHNAYAYIERDKIV